MPWAAGTFSRENGNTGWQDDEAANIGIESGLHDTHDSDIATGINTCLTKDGQNAATADLPMGGFKHTNVGVSTARTHYARSDQVQDGGFTWLGTLAGAANAFTGTFAPAPAAIATGMLFGAIANHNITGAATLNPNGIGAVAIKKFGGTTDVGPGDIVSGQHYTFRKLASSYELLNPTGLGVQVRDSTSQNVTNTTTETTVFTTTIKGGVLGLDRGVRFTAMGRHVNNTGGNVVTSWRVKFGTDQVWIHAADITTSANNRVWKIVAEIRNANSASAQFAHTEMKISATVTALDGSTSSIEDNTFSSMGQDTAPTVNTGSDAVLELTVQHASASASLTTVFSSGYCEVI